MRTFLKHSVFSTLILVFSFQAHADKAAATAAHKKYDAAGKALMAMINSGKVDETRAQELANTMVTEGQVLVSAYSKKHPTTQKLMDYVIANIPTMKSASLEKLEKDWHDAEALTVSLVGLDLKKEENEAHLDPVHVLVHPLITVAAIKQKDLKKAKEEVAEALEQAGSSLANL